MQAVSFFSYWPGTMVASAALFDSTSILASVVIRAGVKFIGKHRWGQKWPVVYIYACQEWVVACVSSRWCTSVALYISLSSLPSFGYCFCDLFDTLLESENFNIVGLSYIVKLRVFAWGEGKDEKRRGREKHKRKRRTSDGIDAITKKSTSWQRGLVSNSLWVTILRVEGQNLHQRIIRKIWEQCISCKQQVKFERKRELSRTTCS